MKKAIFTFSPDKASMNIRRHLLEKERWTENGQFDGEPASECGDVKLLLCSKPSIEADCTDNVDAELFIFATKHESSQGTHSLCVHSPGNWNGNELGGSVKNLCYCPANALREAFLLLKSLAPEGFEVTVEQTHHGPCISKPVIFIEIGSDENSWENEEAGKAIADVIHKLAFSELKDNASAVVFGGGHYNQAANKLLERTSYSVGHICSRFYLEDIDEDMVRQAFEKTVPKPEMAVLDWKGLGPGKSNIVAILEKMGYRYERLKDVLKKNE